MRRRSEPAQMRPVGVWVACLLVSLSGLLAGCGGGDSTSPPPASVPTTIELSATSVQLSVGETTQLAATVKDQRGAVMTTLPAGFVVTWHSADTTRVTVDGTGLARGVRPGSATITAQSGALRATAAASVRSDQLPGASSAPAATAFTFEPFVITAGDYSRTHPELAGMLVSFNTVLLAFHPATTVGEANAILEPLGAEIVGAVPGTTAIPGLLMLRLSTTSHQQMETTLGALRPHPRVRSVVQDVILEPDVTTATDGISLPVPWVWDLTPTGGNWGLERIRAPQMWNLTAAIRKAGGTPPLTGVVDAGFDVSHPDLVFEANLDPTQLHFHGLHVAGTIGATFANGKGVDGVNPFARLIVGGLSNSVAQMVTGYFDLVRSRPGIRVVNMSLGFNWYAHTPPIDSDTSQYAQAVAEVQGDLFSLTQQLLQVLGPLPVVLAAAGNDGGKNARYSSPMTNAALSHGDKNIIVVESVADAPGSAGGATKSGFSNINGHVSAPGSAIMSASRTHAHGSVTHSGPYSVDNGTSMATPHVAGLVGLLYTLDPTLPSPTLTANPVGDLLLANAVAVAGGAKPRIDAFATVLDVDRVQGSNRVLRMLLDVDDGSADGNRRINDTGAPDFDEDHDQDGGPGDGTIDMSDFRRWRDWLLQVENPGGLSLDGSAQHAKKDLNGDGTFGTPFEENVYPRGDFNGDGIISRTATTSVRGFSNDVTDLQVLQQLFVDPNYQAAQLPGLVDAGDLTIDAGDCFSNPNADRVATSIRLKGTTQILEQRTHRAGSTQQVYTAVPNPAGYTARFELFDAANLSLLAVEQDFTITLGGDQSWTLDCSLVRVTINPTIASLTPGATRQFTASVTGTPNTSVTWTATGGTITANGFYVAGQTLGAFEVKATSVANPSKSATAQVTIIAAATPRISFISAPYGERSYWSWIGSSRYCTNRDTNEGAPVPSSLTFPSADCVLPPEAPAGLVGRGSSGLQITLSDVATNLPTAVASLGASFNIVGDGSGSFAGGDAEMDFRFDVLGPVTIAISGTLTAQASDNTQDTHRYALVRLYGRNDIFYAIAGRRFDTDPLSPSSVTVDFSIVLPAGNYDLDIELVASGHDGFAASPHTRNGSARADITVKFSPP